MSMTRKNNASWMVGICLLLIIGIVGCDRVKNISPAREAHYRSLLSSAPCLNGICPGMEGRALLSERLELNPDIEAVVDNGGMPVNFILHNPDAETFGNDPVGGGALVFKPDDRGEFDLLDSIFINMPGFTLATAVEVLGPPDSYLLVAGCGMGYQVFGLFLYPRRGVLLITAYETNQPEMGQLDSKAIVSPNFTTLQGFDEAVLQALTSNVLESVTFDLSPTVDAEFLLAQIRPWPEDDKFPHPIIDLCPR